MKQEKFKIRIDNCGTDSFSSSYKTVKDESAMKLALKVCNMMTNDFVGSIHAPNFEYELAVRLLTKFDDEDLKNIKEEIQKVRDSKEIGWTIKN